MLFSLAKYREGENAMKRERVLMIIIGVLLAVSVLSFSWATVRLARVLTISSLSVDGYGLVIDSDGNWVGKPTGLQDPAGSQGPIGPQGKQGPPGPRGPQGERGPQGIEGSAAAARVPGPQWVVAMGFITKEITVSHGYNISEVIWDSGYERYVITLTGIGYEVSRYVTVITPTRTDVQVGYGTHDNKLWVTLNYGERWSRANFSFIVYEIPLIYQAP